MLRCLFIESLSGDSAKVAPSTPFAMFIVSAVLETLDCGSSQTKTHGSSFAHPGRVLHICCSVGYFRRSAASKAPQRQLIDVQALEALWKRNGKYGKQGKQARGVQLYISSVLWLLLLL
jgi:hypothetical protein